MIFTLNNMKLRFIYIPTILLIFSIFVIYLSLNLELSPPMIVGDSMQPRSFPIFLMIINIILIFVLTSQILREKQKKVQLEGYPTWGSIFLLVLFYFVTSYSDFFIGISVVMFLLSLLWGGKFHVALLTSTISPLALFFLFDKVLKIRFPRGIITNWYYG